MFLTNDQARRFQAHLLRADVRGDCPLCGQVVDWVQVAQLLQLAFVGSVIACTCPRCAVITWLDATGLDLGAPLAEQELAINWATAADRCALIEQERSNRDRLLRSGGQP